MPRLGEVLTDPHPKVQESARDALKQVGNTIRNPEIQGLVPTLLGALADPNKHANAALDMLLNTTFINTIDAPSLALIVPVVQRGITERSGEAKKKAAKIVGSMSTLAHDVKDLQPYVALLLPELQNVLIDPLPEVRATAAKALGSLVNGMGYDSFSELVPWLLTHLKSESSAVERQGSAQGLAEVLAVLGPEHLEALLPDFMANCRSKSLYIREGHLVLFKYLAIAVTDRFGVHLSEVLNCILDGLADEVESVRDAALSAGRTLVELYAETSLPLLLPTVEDGIFAESHRIRQSSVELLGDLLFKISGVSGKIQTDMGEDDEDGGISTETQSAAVTEVLGIERRNEVFARIYMARSDVSLGVRSSALHVWKSLVVNTPKTLTEILPALMGFIIDGLAQQDEERREMSGRSLGELVRKMGDKVLVRIIPIFQQQIYSPLPATRQGVCSGLRETLQSLTKHQLVEHIPTLLPCIQQALCDDDLGVREAAGDAFAEVFRGGASSVVESVVPSLLMSLETGNKVDAALAGLKVILSVRPGIINSILPKIMAQPYEPGRLNALASLAPAAGPALSGHMHSILPVLMRLSTDPENPTLQAAAQGAQKAFALALEEDATQSLVSEVVKALDDNTMKMGAALVIRDFCGGTELDFTEHISLLLLNVVALFAEEKPETLRACWEAADAITRNIPKEEQPEFVRTVRDAVLTARERQRRKNRPGPLLVPGFCLPKGVQPVINIYLQGLLQGASPESRELAADGLGELLSCTSEEVLKPYLMLIAGPLIRILSEKLAPEIKAAVLTAAGLLIERAGVALKALVPQMQTTFLKCLNDPTSRLVRVRAAENVGMLASMVLRPDQLAQDLLNAAKQAAGDASAAEPYLRAIHRAMQSAGERLSAPVLGAIGQALVEMLQSAASDLGDDQRQYVSSTLGMYLRICPDAEATRVLQTFPLNPAACASNGDRTGRALLLAAASKKAGKRLLGERGIWSTFSTRVVNRS